MDNLSRRLSNEDASCTATSMYLSFDAESSISSACYKTMEAMSAVSSMSALSLMDIEEDDDNNTAEKNMNNSTLEAESNDTQPDSSQLKTVKKMELPPMKNSPFKALPKNILKEYKALSSTPSKEQLIKSVNVTRGSDATRCIDLGLAFLGVEDETPAFFPMPQVPIIIHSQHTEENKENAMPESGEGSTLSHSSSTEVVTSVIEKKVMNSMSTLSYTTEDDSIKEIKENINEAHKLQKNYINAEGIKTIQIVDDIISCTNLVKEMVDITSKSLNNKVTSESNAENMLNSNSDDVTKTENADCVQQQLENIQAAIAIGNRDGISDDNGVAPLKKANLQKIDEIEEETIQALKSNSKIVKPRRSVLPTRNVRRSICLPNLETNKPSRITLSGSSGKRASLLPKKNQNTQTLMEVESEIPILLNKMLKISNDAGGNADNLINKPIPSFSNTKPLAVNNTSGNERSAVPMAKSRTSLLPSGQGEKRPYSFKPRMSVIVKTTLNSPARKIARKTSMGATNPTQRRSVMPIKSNTNTNKMESLAARKSMLPKAGSTGAALSGIAASKKISKTSFKEPSSDHMKTMLKTPKNVQQTKMETNSNIKQFTGLLNNKPVASFVCNVCNEKFRVKSILEAHKRSHEGEVTPVITRKNTVSSQQQQHVTSITGASNQCKYCDKKFALVRALHIHLMQNCSKIPPGEKKKLHFTEMNHVEKAQLPKVFSHGNQSSSSGSSSVNATPRGGVPKQTGSVTKFGFTTKIAAAAPKSNSSLETLGIDKLSSDLVQAIDGPTKVIQATTQIPANQQTFGIVPKVPKKKTAHAGVFRTPTKTIPCHLCKSTFKSVIDYTTHSIKVHGTKTHDDDDDDDDCGNYSYKANKENSQ